MENKFSTIQELTEIPKIEYQGYIWKSDQSKPDILPDILNNEPNYFSKVKTNPYIIEGYLYSSENNISISIKQIDGKYFITKVDLSGLDIESDNYVEHKYLSDAAIVKHNPDFKYIKFIQFWEEKKDEFCNGMNVLQPAWVAFVGFGNGGKDD